MSRRRAELGRGGAAPEPAALRPEVRGWLELVVLPSPSVPRGREQPPPLPRRLPYVQQYVTGFTGAGSEGLDRQPGLSPRALRMHCFLGSHLVPK